MLFVASLSFTACSDDPTPVGPELPDPEPSEIEVTVEGVVTSEDAEPVERADVVVFRNGTDEVLGQVATEEEGAFDITFTVTEEDAPDELRLTVEADGFTLYEEILGFGASITREIELDAVSIETAVAGVITDAYSDEPVEGVTVVGIRTDTNEKIFEVTTASQGIYEATFEVETAPAEVTISATAEGFRRSERILDFAQEITADLKIEPRTLQVTVKGNVTSQEGNNPIEGAAVATFRTDVDGEPLDETITDSGGLYELSFIIETDDTPGDLRLEVNGDRFEATDKVVSFAPSVEQNFALAQNRFSLDLSTNGDGSLDVNLISGESNDSGYLKGSEVELIVTPEEDKYFIGWEGDIEGVTNPVVVEIESDLESTANVGYPQDYLGSGVGTVQIGSFIYEASFSLSNNMYEDIVITEFTLLNENDGVVVTASDTLTLEPGASRGYSVDFVNRPTRDQFNQYTTVWEFQFRGETFVTVKPVF